MKRRVVVVLLSLALVVASVGCAVAAEPLRIMWWDLSFGMTELLPFSTAYLS